MGYHIGLYLEIKGKIKNTKNDFKETNFRLEYEGDMNTFDFNRYDKRTLSFNIKRKGYPYGGGFINSLIEEDDEYYNFIMKKFGKIKGKFNCDIMQIYEEIIIK